MNGTGHPGRNDSMRAISAVLGVVTAAALPVLLVGALAVQMRQDIPFGAAALGFGFSVYFALSAAVSPACGRWAQHRPAARGMRWSALTAAASMLGLALAPNWPVVVALLALAGGVNALAQPPSSALLIERVRLGRRAFAFGLKQAAIPAATLLGGLAVPAVALTVGWRWAFVAGAGFALLTALLPPDTGIPDVVQMKATRRNPARSEYLPMVLLAVAAALGTAAVNPLAAFLTSSGVERGFTEGAAGTLLAAGSMASLVMRVFVGWYADRRGERGTSILITAMLAIGAGGIALMASHAAHLYMIGALLAFGAGHAWQGLFNFTVSREWPAATATAIGVTQTGLYAGSAAGPLLFGIVATQAQDATAWLVCAALAATAAVLMMLVRGLYLAPTPSECPDAR